MDCHHKRPKSFAFFEAKSSLFFGSNFLFRNLNNCHCCKPEPDSRWRECSCKAPLVLWFPCCELTCCRTQHKPNVGMTMWMSQLLFFQVQNCRRGPPPAAAPPILLSPDTPLVTTVFILWWGIRGSHINPPANSSLGVYECIGEWERGRGTMKGRSFLGLWMGKNDRGTMLGIYLEAYGTRLSWIHRGSTGIHAHFSFHTEYCVIALWVSGDRHSVDSCIKKTDSGWMNERPSYCDLAIIYIIQILFVVFVLKSVYFSKIPNRKYLPWHRSEERR